MVQHSEVGLLYEHVLTELVQRQYLTLAAACGLVRAAYTEQCSSLALTDLRTARFFLWVLFKMAPGPPNQPEAAALGRLYASSNVNLIQFFPLVRTSFHALDSFNKALPA